MSRRLHKLFTNTVSLDSEITEIVIIIKHLTRVFKYIPYKLKNQILKFNTNHIMKYATKQYIKHVYKVKSLKQNMIY